MPTHQGKSQVDISLGGEGSSVAAHAGLDLVASTSDDAAIVVEDRSGLSDLDVTQQLTARDATGAVLATVSVVIQASASPVGASELTRSRTDRYVPRPIGTSVSWPSAPAASATRDWSVSTPGLGDHQASVEVATTAARGLTVAQTVVEQTVGRLVLQLSVLSGTTSVLDATVTFTTSVEASGSALPGVPFVDDQHWP